MRVIYGKTPLAWVVKKIMEKENSPCMIIDCTKMIILRDNTTIFRPNDKEKLTRLISELPKILPNQKRTIIVYGIPAVLVELAKNEDEKFLNLRIYTFVIKVLSIIAKIHKVFIITPLHDNKLIYFNQTKYYTEQIFIINTNNKQLDLVPLIEQQS